MNTTTADDDELLTEASTNADDGSADDFDDYGYQPVNWRDLTPAESGAAMVELTDWLTWARTRYAIAGNLLPPCWADHSWMIEEYSALHIAWQVCFDPQDSGLGPLQWHERLHHAKDRIKHNSKCSEAAHNADRTPTGPLRTEAVTLAR